MLLGYIDESYNDKEYWLTGLMIPSPDALPLQRDLDQVVASAEKYGVPSSAELHGHPLQHGKDDWEPMRSMVRARIKVYSDALDAIASYPNIEIAFRGIDILQHKKKYANPWHPHRVALDYLCQSMNSMARGRGENFLAIADEVDRSDTLRQSYYDFQRGGTLSRFNRTIDRSIDSLHFAPSKHSRLLQAADLVSYLHYRIRCSGVKDHRARSANEKLMSKIQHQRRVWDIWPKYQQ